MNLELVKSAKVVLPDEVLDIDKKFREHHGDDAHTKIIMRDGGLTVTKQTAKAIDADGVPTLKELQDLCFKRGVKWNDDYKGRAKAWWASDERSDRHGDIVVQSWEFDEFEDNPVMLFSHEWGLPPIGGVLAWEVKNRMSKKYSGDALHLVGLFALGSAWDWAETVFRLTDAGFLRSGSVGFMPGSIVNVTDPEERQKLGLGQYGLVFKDNRLLEWSPTSIPANPGAHQVLSEAKSKGLVQPSDLQVLRELTRREMQPTRNNNLWVHRDAMMITMWRTLFPEVRVPPTKEMDVPLLLEELEIRSNVMNKNNPPPPPPANPQPQATLDNVLQACAGLGEMIKTLQQQVTNLTALVENGKGSNPTPPPPPGEGGTKSVELSALEKILSA